MNRNFVCTHEGKPHYSRRVNWFSFMRAKATRHRSIPTAYLSSTHNSLSHRIRVLLKLVSLCSEKTGWKVLRDCTTKRPSEKKIPTMRCDTPTDLCRLELAKSCYSNDAGGGRRSAVFGERNAKCHQGAVTRLLHHCHHRQARTRATTRLPNPTPAARKKSSVVLSG